MPLKSNTICNNCGDKFYASPCHPRKYCSRKCREKDNTYEKKFWRRVVKNSNNKCWGWKRSTDKFGYAHIEVDRLEKYAHRISWEIHFGEIPEGMFVCHTCDNPSCTNPNHLFLGTYNDNIQDMIKKGRNSRGEKRYNAKLTEKQVLKIRSLGNNSSKLHREIAEIYGISQSRVTEIINRKAWKWL